MNNQVEIYALLKGEKEKRIERKNKIRSLKIKREKKETIFTIRRKQLNKLVGRKKDSPFSFSLRSCSRR